MLKYARSPITPCAPKSVQTTILGNGHRRRLSHYLGNSEPVLEDLLDDDVMRRIMASDGVTPEHLLEMAARMREAQV